MITALISLLLAGTLHHPPAYEFHGDADLGHGAITISVDMSRYGNDLHDLDVYVDSANGYDDLFTPLHYDGKTNRWVGTLSFTKEDDPGKWFVVSVDGFRGPVPSTFIARDFPNPSFWVDGK
jgi:hypothetical protein